MIGTGTVRTGTCYLVRYSTLSGTYLRQDLRTVLYSTLNLYRYSTGTYRTVPSKRSDCNATQNDVTQHPTTPSTRQQATGALSIYQGQHVCDRKNSQKLKTETPEQQESNQWGTIMGMAGQHQLLHSRDNRR